jgi:2Fe-2S ferredoxin
MRNNTETVVELAEQKINDTIAFKVICFDEEKMIQTYKGEYRNLMTLLNERFYLESFGECRGMGRCCTCVVKVKAMENCLAGKQRNEASTLNKMGIDQPNMRLACQIMIDEELDNAEITIDVF